MIDLHTQSPGLEIKLFGIPWRGLYVEMEFAFPYLSWYQKASRKRSTAYKQIVNIL